MEEVYIFKIALKYRKSLWRRIEIRSNQTLSDFDHIIRKAFNYDTFDHLSAFFSGKAWRSQDFGQIEPSGGGSGAKTKLFKLGLSKGDTLEYVYDFGDNVQHIIRLEKIVAPEEKIKYPRVTSKNRPKYRLCKICKDKGKKTVATQICIECSQAMGKVVTLCRDCLMKEHDSEHYVEEILY